MPSGSWRSFVGMSSPTEGQTARSIYRFYMVYILFLNSTKANNIWWFCLVESKSRIHKSIKWYKNSLIFSENGSVSKTGSVESCYEQIDSSSQPHILFHQVSLIVFSQFFTEVYELTLFSALWTKILCVFLSPRCVLHDLQVIILIALMYLGVSNNLRTSSLPVR